MELKRGSYSRRGSHANLVKDPWRHPFGKIDVWEFPKNFTLGNPTNLMATITNKLRIGRGVGKR